MVNFIPKPIIHVFTEFNQGKYLTTKHYKLDHCINGKTLLSDEVNISKDRSFAKSTPSYWLKIRNGKKWSKNITGLFKINARMMYRGDHQFRKHLLLFHFSDNAEVLMIYFYQDYYTNDLTNVLNRIDLVSHNEKSRVHNPTFFCSNIFSHSTTE